MSLFRRSASFLQCSKHNSLVASSYRCLTSASASPAVATVPDVEPYVSHNLPPDKPLQNRRNAIKNARPFSDFLTDTYNREHNYLRISLTEKCNLRCLYCMPEEGVPQSPPRELLTTPEIFLLSSVFVSEGVTKIRLTGGEPTVRRDILPLMHQIGSLRSQGLRELCITTNGISLHRKLDSMAEAGLTGVNLSLDTLDPWQFQIMTRRKGFEAVMKSIDRILEMNRLGAGIKLKINCVVMRGMNEREIVPFVELGQEQDIEVRFIEYMPFDGNKWSKGKMLPFQEMLDIIRAKYPSLRKVQDQKNDTSKTYEIPGFVGRMGFITSMTHNFCGSCNRLRITSDGNLKVCLFGNAEVSLRDIIRKANDGNPIEEEAYEAMKQLEMNRKEGLGSSESPLGRSTHEKELLDVIGLAVSRKKEKHAGMGELENMKNRPMILIGGRNAQKPIRTSPQVIPSLRPWTRIPTHFLLSPTTLTSARHYSTRIPPSPSTTETKTDNNTSSNPTLTHLTPQGNVHMVSISSKTPTVRTAIAKCTIHFSNPTAIKLIRSNGVKKGDVLAVSRIAGIMAAKKTGELIPLCHPVSITGVDIGLEVCGGEDFESTGEVSSRWQGTGQGDAYPWHRQDFGHVEVTTTVTCKGKTGVEMEALTAAGVAALTVYDMCKSVDKGMRIGDLRVIRKEGGKSGLWVEGKKENVEGKL
ncbi:hypothetical protein HYALB_00001676 [Hymenoscyphus albidus]|uniref:Radical SAM core domain-containing protein n=1 Tax=Hymenoscyphus albidus TaxID=595503 RepID=A0A9N9LDU4_9HELO|nr:hypothetical protein HYALB_00001676 [Hymenoscyphus albidus]